MTIEGGTARKDPLIALQSKRQKLLQQALCFLSKDDLRKGTKHPHTEVCKCENISKIADQSSSKTNKTMDKVDEHGVLSPRHCPENPPIRWTDFTAATSQKALQRRLQKSGWQSARESGSLEPISSFHCQTFATNSHSKPSHAFPSSSKILLLQQQLSEASSSAISAATSLPPLVHRSSNLASLRTITKANDGADDGVGAEDVFERNGSKRMAYKVSERLSRLFNNVFEAFVFFDHYGTGSITNTDLRVGLLKTHILQDFENQEALIARVLEFADQGSKDGQLDLVEFVSAFAWHPVSGWGLHVARAKRRRRQLAKRALAKVKAEVSGDSQGSLRPYELVGILHSLHHTERIFGKFASLEQSTSSNHSYDVVTAQGKTMDFREFLLVLQDANLLMPDKDPSQSVVSVPLAIKVFKQAIRKERLAYPDHDDSRMTFEVYQNAIRQLARYLGVAVLEEDETVYTSVESILERRSAVFDRMQRLEGAAKDTISPGMWMRQSNGWSGQYLAVDNLSQEQQNDYKDLQKEIRRLDKLLEAKEDLAFQQDVETNLSAYARKLSILKARMSNFVNRDLHILPYLAPAVPVNALDEPALGDSEDSHHLAIETTARPTASSQVKPCHSRPQII